MGSHGGGAQTLIAGCSEATGAEFARQLAAEGLSLIPVARREGPLAALAEELRGSVDHVCSQNSHLLQHSRQMSNIVIALDGDKAGSESYVTATLRMERE